MSKPKIEAAQLPHWGVTSSIFGALSATIVFLVTYSGYPFEYPRLFHVIAVVLAAALTLAYYIQLRNRRNSKSSSTIAVHIIVFFLPVLIMCFALAWAAERFWGLPPTFDKNEIGILIAEVPDQTAREQQIIYQTAIIDRIRYIQSLRDIVKVRLIERPLPFDVVEQQKEALKIGRWLGASFALRPFDIENTQEPRLTAVNYQDLFSPNPL